MIKIFSGKLWIALISACCLGGSIVLACSDWGGEEYGVSNFSPAIFVDSSYSPFFYSSQFYYGINYEDNQLTRFNENNLTEWATFLKNAATRNELQYLLQKASKSSIDSVVAYTSGKSGAIPVSMQSLTVLKQKNNTQLNAFFNYLALAKKCEVFSLNEMQDSWSIDTTVKKTPIHRVAGLELAIKNGFLKTTDVFLKERYWFQLIRLYFFLRQPAAVN